MATAGDGAAPYQGGGAGGKFRKRPIRRSAPATPYERPHIALRNNNPSLFAKLVDPASRLIYAGADRVFGVFRKQLLSLPSQRPPVFGSAAWQQSSAFGSSFGSASAPFSFGASSTTIRSPIVFGSGASTGSSTFSFTAAGATNSSFPPPVFGNPTPNNTNNHMSMEDSMAEDPMQTPSPSVPTFGQAPAPTGAPGFMFGSATQPPTTPFQFGGQASPAPPQNPFQASGSIEFNGGGSFSLGSGGGDKAGRRIFKVAKSKNRRK